MPCQALPLGRWVRQACVPLAPQALWVGRWALLLRLCLGQAVWVVRPCQAAPGQPCPGSCPQGPLAGPGPWDQGWEHQEVRSALVHPGALR